MSETASTSSKVKRHSIKRRIVRTFIAVIVAIISLGTLGGYQYLYWYEHQVTDQMATSAAESCKAFFDAMASTVGGEPFYEPEEYEEWRMVLRNLCKTSDMEYMYAFEYDPDNGTATYIMCVAADDERDEVVRRERGEGTVVKVEMTDQIRRALAGEAVNDAMVIENQYGSDLAWFKKVESWDNVLAGVDYSMHEQRARVFTIVTAVIIPFVLILILLFILQLRLLNKRVFMPLQAIAGRVRQFAPDHANEFTSLGVEENNEIGDIANAIEGMASNIDAYLGDIERMTAERMQADVELDVARRIQQGIVPERAATVGNGFDVLAVSRAAREVGGDFHDTVKLDDGRIAAVVGDVSGKGIAAALFMAMTRTMIHDRLQSGRGPAETLNEANGLLCAENPEGMFATVLACVFDPATGEVCYANAGHMPPLLVGDGAHMLDVDPGVLLGLFDDVCLEEGSLVLECGQGLLLYTDGVTEAVNAERAFLGDRAFTEHMTALAPYPDAVAVVEAAVGAVDDFVGEYEQFDDLTMVAIMRGEANRVVASEPGVDGDDTDTDKVGASSSSTGALPCAMASFAAVRDALLALDASDELKRKACLAAEEMFANIAMYSGASSIRHDIGLEGGAVCIVLEDDGIAFDPTAATPDDKDFEDLDTGGMGISLVRQLTSSIAYRREGDHNILELIVE